MMTLIAGILGLSTPKLKQIGIEIEVEGSNLPVVGSNQGAWRVEPDSSLRNECCEFVLKDAVNLSEVKNVLDQLDQTLKLHNSDVHEAYRAGIHVHINVQDFTPTQVITFACCYLLVEELLLNWCKENRRGNHFCLRAKDAEYLVWNIQEVLKTGNLKLFATDNIRYSSINFSSLFKHGTIEFRSLESTTDWDRIYKWCELLYQLKIVSLSYENPVKFFEDVQENGTGVFLEKCFGIDNVQLLLYPGIQEGLKTGKNTVEDIVYERDWNERNLNIFRKDTSYF
jgi:hypothetical protein